MKEIERKFLVIPDKLPIKQLLNYQIITQAYLHDTNPITRVRLITHLEQSTATVQSYQPDDSKAYITLKGPGLLERDEIEFEIPLDKASEAIRLWGKSCITKHRFIYCLDVKWEIDFFKGYLDGLVIAEVELESQDQEFIIPEWIGREVTNDPEYTNVMLAKNGMPY
jgi:adenylate cyclase